MKQNSNDNVFEIIRSGYDKIAGRYVEEREKIDNWQEIDEFCAKLPAKAKILDVGCGTGIPIARYLSQNGFEVVGIDLSKEMVTVAKRNVQGARFLQMNMTDIEFPPESFDGLISCYAIFHVPRSEHAAIFQSFYRILKPDGILLASVGAGDWEGVEDYHGVDMFWSHFDPLTTQSLITEAGFDIEFGRNVESGGEVHHWILTRKG
ncbi:class I SAM-dependent methyltransferase [Candidatus Zixiibacteriota bacterium]